MANHEHTENRRPGKRPLVTHDKATRSQVAEIVALDGLTEHLGYLIRRAQIWVFQDFIRTLAAVNIRPAQYSVLTVIYANAGMTQMSLSKTLGIERARLVHLLNELEARNSSNVAGPKPTDVRTRCTLPPKDAAPSQASKHLRKSTSSISQREFGRKNHQLLLRLLACFASG